MAKDALCILDHLNWKENVHIIGLSMGGMITQELAKLDLERFSSISLISTFVGGLYSLFLLALSIPTGIVTLAKTFLTTDPKMQLIYGMQLIYPQEILVEKSLNKETGEMEENFKKFKRALIKRGVKTQADGMPPKKFKTIVKQAMAVNLHSVSKQELQKLGMHFGNASLVITGDSDILVHKNNSYVLAEGLGADLHELPKAGHGKLFNLIYIYILQNYKKNLIKY